MDTSERSSLNFGRKTERETGSRTRCWISTLSRSKIRAATMSETTTRCEGVTVNLSVENGTLLSEDPHNCK